MNFMSNNLQYFTIRHPDEYCIITDYWEGGDLYEYIGNHQYLQE